MKFFFLIIFSILLANCTYQSKNTSDSTLPVLNLTKDYPVKDINIHDIADVEYIPLETTDSVLLYYADQYRISDKYIITYEIKDNNGTVHFFDRKGKHLRRINHYGQGPEEHNWIRCFAVDFDKEEYYIYDGTKMQVYSFIGEWQRTLKVPQGISYEDLFDCNEQYLIGENIFHDYWNPDNLPEDQTPYYLIDKKSGEHISLPIRIGNRVSRTLEKRIEHIDANVAKRHFNRMSIISSLLANGNEFLIADFGLDTIYSYKDNNLNPIAVQYPSVHSNKTPLIIAPRYYTDKFMIFKPVKFRFTPEYINLPYEEAPNLMWDRKSNEIYQINFHDSNFIGREIRADMGGIKFLDSNYLINIILADRLCEFYEKGNVKGELKELASKMKEDNNSVIAIYKLKE